MKTRKQIKNIVDKTVGASFRDGKLLDKTSLKFIKLFKSQPKIEAIALLSEYLKRVRLVIGSTTMAVESVTPLSKKDKLKLEKSFGSRFIIHNAKYQLNPQLLGGLRVQIGDHIFENSILSRIKQVGEVIHG